MRKIYMHYLMIYWSKKAKMYNDIIKMYVDDIEGFNHIYSTGLAVVKRDYCLGMVERIHDLLVTPKEGSK